MLLVQGNCNLYNFLDILNKNKELITKYEKLIDHKSKIFYKIKLEFIEQLLAIPIIIYLKKDSIKNNSHNSNIEDYISKIEHFDNPELIFFLDNIAKSDRKSLNVKWIALELNEEINFNMSKLFRDFIFLDFALDKQGLNGSIAIVD